MNVEATGDRLMTDDSTADRLRTND